MIKSDMHYVHIDNDEELTQAKLALEEAYDSPRHEMLPRNTSQWKLDEAESDEYIKTYKRPLDTAGTKYLCIQAVEGSAVTQPWVVYFETKEPE
jgi:hypothetical protein